MVNVLVIADSRGGLTEQLGRAIAEGAAAVPNTQVAYRNTEEATQEELLDADALILGSPNYSGITGRLKNWLDGLGELWESGALVGKVGAAFTAGRTRSGGNEFTLLSIIHVLLANGLIIVGLPYSEAMDTSGSYYGAIASGEITEQDLEQAKALGRRVASVAAQLA